MKSPGFNCREKLALIQKVNPAQPIDVRENTNYGGFDPSYICISKFFNILIYFDSGNAIMNMWSQLNATPCWLVDEVFTDNQEDLSEAGLRH